MKFSMIPGAGSCDRQFPIISSIGKGPKGDKGDAGTGYPKVASPIEWDQSKTYDPYTLVLDELGNSHMSIKYVPSGTSLSDGQYWVQTSVFSAQLAQCLQQIGDIGEDVSTMHGDIAGIAEYLGRIHVGHSSNVVSVAAGSAIQDDCMIIPFDNASGIIVYALPESLNENLSLRVLACFPDYFRYELTNSGVDDASTKIGYVAFATGVTS